MVQVKKMIVGAMLIAGFVTAAPAQRDPAYAAARAAGQVGEQPNGYLGVVSGGAAVQAIVDKINIQRKALYAEKAQAAGVTINDFGVTSGCNLIEQTQAGEKYKAPDGSWKTRGSGAPERSASCV